MTDMFRADKFHMERVMDEFLVKEVEERMKEYEVQAMIGGKRVAANIGLVDGCILVDVETPVVFL